MAVVDLVAAYTAVVGLVDVYTAVGVIVEHAAVLPVRHLDSYRANRS